MDITTGLLPNSGNYKRGRTSKIKYIVIHYTANKGDTALNNVKYFANNVAKASAHYFVDENSVYTSVPTTGTAWHCGGRKQSKSGGKWYGKCTNANSIGVEMCLWDKNGAVRTRTILKTVELTKYLMKLHNIPADNVIRHWDVVGKACPAPFMGDNNAYWQDFKNRITDTNGDDEPVEKEMIYNYIDDNMPEFARPTIQKLCDKGYLKGDSNGLNLKYDMLRLLTILDRAGVFDLEG